MHVFKWLNLYKYNSFDINVIVYNMDFDKGIIFAEYKLPPFCPIRTRFRVLVAHD